ncbi:oligosaccharide flippase family protein [Geobacter hydrogenophilus]|uniref:oligosaccharide flippase family protein n=1 Tax=Geobacter hydrogenophilus TaxID=40983 RepID=UPI001BD91A15|nr:oligosaccharide flippase family protein [Geobacter hydrogenophilus]
MTRLYQPSEFGEFTIFMAWSGFLTVIATGRYEMAVMLPKREVEAANIIGLCAFVAVVFSCIIMIIVMTIYFLNKIGFIHVFHSWLFFIPLSVLFAGFYQTLINWMSRNKSFGLVATNRMLQAIVVSLLSILFAYLTIGSYGLILGSVIGQMVATVFLYFKAPIQFGQIKKQITIHRMRTLAIRHKDFPQINSLHVIIDSIKASVIPILIGNNFGASALGHFSFAVRIVQAPLGIIGSSIAQVLFQRVSQQYSNEQDSMPTINNILLKLAKTALPLFLLIALFAPGIFVFLFGEKWREAGIYAVIMTPWMAAGFFASVLSLLPIVFNQQKKVFLLALVGNSLMLLSILIGTYYWNEIRSALILWSLLLTVYMLYVIYWTYRLVKYQRG